ncbi:ATP-grasp domain-containing protein [Blautia sp.]|jgi:biotin carboxylase|uniref:ATP-grasp domain-containing protein n=1 Tax=Blautia sp. TaxID=1955243 RepID=UPI003D8AC16E
MDKLAIIGTGYMARIIANRAKELNIETHCFSIDEHSVAGEVCDFFHNVNILDIDALTEVCRKIDVNGVVATTELTIYPASVVAKRLGLNGNDETVSKEVTDKTIIRRKVKNIEELFQPRFWICGGIQDIPKINNYPVIVKPIAAGGKRGISVVKTSDNIKTAITEALSVSKVKGVLIEEFLSDGQEYSVESLSYHGSHYIIQVTQKDSSGPPHCVELGHHQPAELLHEMRKKVEKVVSRILTTVGITDGPCHTEIKIIDGKIYLIELNGRPGGDHIAYPLTELSTGYPYITGIIQVALNKLDETQLKNFEKNYSGVHFVTTQTAYMKPIFDNCETEQWLYYKNKVSDKLSPITHNDGFNTNYFIYYSREKKPNFEDMKGKNYE